MSHLWILSAASGTGKTSLVRQLLQQDRQVEVAVSHTTRQPRPKEIHGKDYHFLTEAEFRTKVQQSGFIEHAEVFGNFYGTSRDEVAGRLSRGVDVVLEIDWQGARQIRLAMPEAKSIFIFPPSLEKLRERLTMRAEDKPAVIERRLSEAKVEIAKAVEFDYWVVNDDFDQALVALNSIIKAHRFERALMQQSHPNLMNFCGNNDKSI